MEAQKKPPVNIGILAHVDGGKTTLTEQILYISGAVRSLGRVDDGSAHTDFMEIERERGISVRAASAFLDWKGQRINLIDTPGHSDFSGEVQRALRALDFAVLVLSAVEGVQSQTELLWKVLRAAKLPVIFFINKTDRTGADVSRVLEEIKDIFSVRPIAAAASKEELAEAVSDFDDSVMEKYLDGGAESIPDSELASSFKKGFADGRIYPYLAGSALKGEGVAELLDTICLLAGDEDKSSEEPSGVIFKLEHDPVLGRVSFIRLFAGTIKNRDILRNLTRGCDEKVVQIRKVVGKKEIDSGVLTSGDIGAVYGLSRAGNGDVIGSGAYVPKESVMTAPMLRVKITPEDENSYPALVSALEQLSAEDPLLDVIWQKESRELLIKITGMIQTEVVASILKERFGLAVLIGEPQVIYKEHPLKRAEGYVEYTMPKPCWAVMNFIIEPLPAGSGVVFESIVHNDKIYQRYQAQVAQTIPEALRQGPKGWEVTDIKITLADGEHHTVHTHPLDFMLATPMGIMDGLVNSGTELLEPILKFRLSFPEEYSGKIIGEIISMRGTFDSPVIIKGMAVMEGRMPLSTSMNFPMRLSSVSGGRGVLFTSFDGYEPVPPGEGVEVPYRGVSPLDRAKYILFKRGALGNI